jgi:dienelactone hydrolase
MDPGAKAKVKREHRSDSELRARIAALIGFAPPVDSPKVERVGRTEMEDHIRWLIRYRGDGGDKIPAYLLVPPGRGPFPAVVVHHQHAGQRHLGKSEVVGLAGDPHQAFGPALVARGIVVLAPDSICFEDRRRIGHGIEPLPETDWYQHYTMALSVAASLPEVKRSIGELGHSYGGNTVLFHAALDERVAFACSSGAACTYRTKIEQETPIEMAEVIPGITTVAEIDQLVACIAPRPLLITSATDDEYSRDADEIERAARPAWDALGASGRFEHYRVAGPHELDATRADKIVRWVAAQAQTAGLHEADET